MKAILIPLFALLTSCGWTVTLKPDGDFEVSGNVNDLKQSPIPAEK